MLIYCNFRASSLPKELKRVVDQTHISSAWPKPRTGLLTRSWSDSSKCNNSKALQYRISTDAPVSTSTRRSSVVPRSFWVTSEETTRGSGATLWLAPSPHQWTRWLPLGPCVWLLIGLLHLCVAPTFGGVTTSWLPQDFLTITTLHPLTLASARGGSSSWGQCQVCPFFQSVYRAC